MIEEARERVRILREVTYNDCIGFPYAVCTTIHNIADLIESLSAQLEQVTRERDAMRRQLHKGGRACESCRYAEDTPDNNAVCAECRPEGEDSLWSHWEWCGVEVIE